MKLKAFEYWSRVLLTMATFTLLGGCGFHPRGQVDLPFDSAYIDAPANSLTEQLKRSLRASNKLIADKRESGEITIRLNEPTQSKRILSLSGAGRVKEYRIEYKVSMTVLDRQGKELLGTSEVSLSNDFTYDDKQILAKENEEALLFQNMEQDALRTLLIRLRFAKTGGIAQAK